MVRGVNRGQGQCPSPEKRLQRNWGRWEGQKQEEKGKHNQGLCVVCCSSESPWVSQQLSSRHAMRASRDAGAFFHSHSAGVFKICLACGTVNQVAKEKEWLSRGPSEVCLVLGLELSFEDFPILPHMNGFHWVPGNKNYSRKWAEVLTMCCGDHIWHESLWILRGNKVCSRLTFQIYL